MVKGCNDWIKEVVTGYSRYSDSRRLGVEISLGEG
jgi:hypothetical protein